MSAANLFLCVMVIVIILMTICMRYSGPFNQWSYAMPFPCKPFMNSLKSLFPLIAIKREHVDKADPSKDSQVIVDGLFKSLTGCVSAL